jgi:hypothetical protein
MRPRSQNSRHTPAGHPEGTKPKTGEDKYAAKGGEGHVVSEMLRRPDNVI